MVTITTTLRNALVSIFVFVVFVVFGFLVISSENVTRAWIRPLLEERSTGCGIYSCFHFTVFTQSRRPRTPRIGKKCLLGTREYGKENGKGHG